MLKTFGTSIIFRIISYSLFSYQKNENFKLLVTNGVGVPYFNAATYN